MEPPIISAFIGGFVAISVLVASQVLAARTARRERRRVTLQSWQARLTDWADEHGHPQGTPPHVFGKFASRQETELSLQRKERYVAWWIYEMAAEIVTVRNYASRSLADQQMTVHRIAHLVDIAGDRLVAWHHGKLRTEDFDISRRLFQSARDLNIDPYSLALYVGLRHFVDPRRLTLKVKYVLSGIVLRDTTGMALQMMEPSLQRKIKAFFLLRAICQVFPIHHAAKSLFDLRLLRIAKLFTARTRSKLARWARERALDSVKMDNR